MHKILSWVSSILPLRHWRRGTWRRLCSSRCLHGGDATGPLLCLRGTLASAPRVSWIKWCVTWRWLRRLWRWRSRICLQHSVSQGQGLEHAKILHEFGCFLSFSRDAFIGMELSSKHFELFLDDTISCCRFLHVASFVHFAQKHVMEWIHLSARELSPIRKRCFIKT